MLYPSCHGMWSKWAPPLERSRLATMSFSGYIIIVLDSMIYYVYFLFSTTKLKYFYDLFETFLSELFLYTNNRKVSYKVKCYLFFSKVF